jgi:hypothetical protein
MNSLLIGAALLLACYQVQRWSDARRTARSRTPQVDIPRWEDEGGAPNPDEAALPASHQDVE